MAPLGAVRHRFNFFKFNFIIIIIIIITIIIIIVIVLHICAFKILTCKPMGKRLLGRPRSRWEDNIRMELKELGINWVD